MAQNLPNTGVTVWNDTTDSQQNYRDWYNMLTGLTNSNMAKIDNAVGGILQDVALLKTSEWLNGVNLKTHRRTGSYVCINNPDSPFVNTHLWSQLFVDEMNSATSIITIINSVYGIYLCMESNGVWGEWSQVAGTRITDLNNNLTLLNGFRFRGDSQYFIRSGEMGVLNLKLSCPAITEGAQVATLPSDIRPLKSTDSPASFGGIVKGKSCTASVDKDGTISLWDFEGTIQSGAYLSINMSYLIS